MTARHALREKDEIVLLRPADGQRAADLDLFPVLGAAVDQDRKRALLRLFLLRFPLLFPLRRTEQVFRLLRRKGNRLRLRFGLPFLR
jgi:hypothetical protein